MTETEVKWWLAAAVVLVAILYVLMINFVPLMERHNIRSVIKKTAKEENKAFLIQNASYHHFAKKHWYFWLLTSVFLVVVMLKFEHVYMPVEGYEETFWSIVMSILFAIFFLMHAIVGAVATLFLICVWGDEKRSPLEVRDFLSTQEISIMRLVNTQMRERSGLPGFDEEDYRTEGGMAYWRVHSPDELMAVMKDREKLLEYHEIQMKLYRMENVDKELLTPEQVKRNEEFEQTFHDSLVVLEPHLEQIKLATDKAHFQSEQKKKLDKNQIRQDFDGKQAEAERALMALNQAIQFEEKQEHPPVSEAIRELRRVADSELVSPELKKQASSLIDRIEEKQLEMRNQQETELVDGEALTIIRANELFYGLAETDITK